MIKYIFSINTGRSGSSYLSTVLQHCYDVKSCHEPKPIMNKEPMVKFLKGNPKPLESLMDEKLQQINTRKGDNSLYIETNHVFIKSFGWLIPSRIPQEEIGVVLLKRDKKDIINSQYRIDCTPLNYFGRIYLLTPLMKNAVNKITFLGKIKFVCSYYFVRFIHSQYNKKTINIKKPAYMKQYEYELLDWYVEETYAQGERFKKKFPNIKIYETSIDKLNNVEEYHKMFEFFNLEFKPKPSFFEVLGKKTNLKSNRSNN